MTKEQIKKALECCKWDDVSLCKLCPFYKASESLNCISGMATEALSLIDELLKENEKLKILNKLFEQDVEDWRKLAESKAEEIYPEFMRDYNCMREELEGLYEELAELRRECGTDKEGEE